VQLISPNDWQSSLAQGDGTLQISRRGGILRHVRTGLSGLGILFALMQAFPGYPMRDYPKFIMRRMIRLEQPQPSELWTRPILFFRHQQAPAAFQHDMRQLRAIRPCLCAA
jgi:hypothetical protein